MKVSWQHVAIVGLILGSIVALGAFGRDTTALLALGTLLLAGVGLTLGQGVGIKEQTNGNTSKLLEMVEKQGQLLAAMQPPPPPPVTDTDPATEDPADTVILTKD